MVSAQRLRQETWLLQRIKRIGPYTFCRTGIFLFMVDADTFAASGKGTVYCVRPIFRVEAYGYARHEGHSFRRVS